MELLRVREIIASRAAPCCQVQVPARREMPTSPTEPGCQNVHVHALLRFVFLLVRFLRFVGTRSLRMKEAAFKKRRPTGATIRYASKDASEMVRHLINVRKTREIDPAPFHEVDQCADEPRTRDGLVVPHPNEHAHRVEICSMTIKELHRDPFPRPGVHRRPAGRPWLHIGKHFHHGPGPLTQFTVIAPTVGSAAAPAADRVFFSPPSAPRA